MFPYELVSFFEQDFSSVADCTAASQLAYMNSLATLLGMSSTGLSSTCSYGYINVNSRRRRGRALQQVWLNVICGLIKYIHI